MTRRRPSAVALPSGKSHPIEDMMRPVGRRPTRGEAWCFGGHEISRNRRIDFVLLVGFTIARCGAKLDGVGHAKPEKPTCAACLASPPKRSK